MTATECTDYTYLDMSVDQPVQFNVVVILSERIYEHFSNFQPANVKNELK